MDIFDNAKKIGFKISWKFIRIGYRGNAIFGNCLEASDVIAFALEQLAVSQDEDIVNLACEYCENTEDVEKYLVALADKEKSVYDTELRKWRVLYVLNNLPRWDEDCVQGLLALGDVWCSLGFPADSPHIYQGIGNSISPNQYYTDENYQFLLNEHIDWLNKEVEYIRENQ